MTPQEREEIRARLERIATKEPWEAVEMTHFGQPGTGFWSVQPVTEVDEVMDEGDAVFIAHAPDDVRALLSEVDRLTGALAAMTAAHEAAIRERDEAQNAVADLAVGRRQMQLQRERAEARIRELEQERDEARATVEAVGVALAGQGGVTDFELTLPHVLAVVDALAALNRSNALLTGAEARIRELERERARIVALIGDDATAATYQTMGQYRSMLLKALKTPLAASRVIR